MKDRIEMPPMAEDPKQIDTLTDADLNLRAAQEMEVLERAKVKPE